MWSPCDFRRQCNRLSGAANLLPRVQVWAGWLSACCTGETAGMDLRISGRRALVTGGTRGLGRAVVDRLVEEGCAVALCARSAPAPADNPFG